jgi:hypothetical protein
MAITRVSKLFHLAGLICVASLGGCDNGAMHRSGMMSPMSTDPTPIKVSMNGKRYLLPENCLDSPLEKEGEDGEFHIIDGALLRVTLPDLECRTRSNGEALYSAGENAPGMSILIDRMGKGMSERRDLENVYSIYTHQNPLNRDVTAEYVRNDRGEVTAFGTLNLVFSKMEWQDVFGGPDQGYLIICGRSAPPYHPGGPPHVGICQHWFAYKGMSVSAHYGRGWLRDQSRIQAAIVSKLDRMRVAQ